MKTKNRVQLLCDLMENQVYGYIALDQEGTIVGWNVAAERITGYTVHEAIGKPLSLIFTPEDVELKIARRELERALADGSAEDHRWHRRKDGSRFWATGALTVVRDESGEITGLSKIFRDDTIRKETETSIRIANEELRRFTYIAAHDLKQPLRTSMVFLEKVLKDISAPEPAEHLKIAHDALRRMRALIDDLLAYSETEGKPVMSEKVDCNAILEEALANLKDSLDTSGAILAHSVLPILPGVPSQLVRLFQNLIDNAIKYAKPGETPKIQINAVQKDAYWLISIKDEGIGIDPQDQERVFSAFERVHTAEMEPGSGLGLSICRRIVERHGGRIWVESEPGKGSIFYFTLKESI